MKRMLKMRVNQIEIPVENTSSTDRKDKVETIYSDIYKEEKCGKNCKICLRHRIEEFMGYSLIASSVTELLWAPIFSAAKL